MSMYDSTYLQKVLHTQWFRFVTHLLFWLVAIFFFLLFFSTFNDNFWATAILAALPAPVAIAVSYYFNYYLFPKFLYTRRYGRFVLYGCYTVLFSFWLSSLIIIYILIFFFTKTPYNIHIQMLEPLMQIVGLYFIVFLAVAIKQVKRAFETQQRNNQLERLKLQNELKLKEARLKLIQAQIHPHFLFNTLNSIYGLTLEKSDKAPDLVMRLSDMLDYMLYTAQTKRVELNDELDMIRNYVAIEQFRLGDTVSIHLSVSGGGNGLKIAPLLLLPVVENCFKHGVRAEMKKPFIEIEIEVNEHQLELKTMNL